MRLPRSKEKLFLKEILLLVLVILIIAGGGGLGIIWLKSHTTGTAKKIQQIEWETDKLTRKEQYIDAQLAVIRSPDYLNQWAKQFGLRPPRDNQIVRLPLDPSEPLPVSEKNTRYAP